jgi:hypothetical protein
MRASMGCSAPDQGHHDRWCLELLSPLDYMHMDIQGAELDFRSYRPELLDAKVRLVNIGTHSAKIEVGLRQLFNASTPITILVLGFGYLVLGVGAHQLIVGGYIFKG